LRTLVLVDGEHHPPVVRAAVDHLPTRLPGAVVVGAALVGGREKLPATALSATGLSGGAVSAAGVLGLGVPVEAGTGASPSPDDVLAAALRRFRPDLVFDLSDEPVLDPRTRLRLAARALAAGVSYAGPDFRFEPPPRPRLASKPSVAVIATGKRAGKTAVTAHTARLLRSRGRAPVIVAMSRGGPLEPEVIDPAAADLSPAGLLALADEGRHAASDHLEDAVTAGVVTVGTRRCGGGLAGTPADATFAAGVALGDARPEAMLLYEGSGAAIPPAHADATVCLVPATADPELVSGYLGLHRILLSDLIVVTMAESSFADSGARVSDQGGASRARLADLERSVRGLAPGVPVVRTVLRPTPLGPISGRRVFYVTAAPADAVDLMAGHLEREHGCKVVGTSSHLAHRRALAADLEGLDAADVLVVELKAAAIDLATRIALGRGTEVVFCDNRVVSAGGDATFDELALATADQAVERFQRLEGRAARGPDVRQRADTHPTP
jgi:cyclic 2,3-diphosphoglycerate synthetase